MTHCLLFRDLITGQENQLKEFKAGQEKMEERLETKMEAQAKDSKAGQEKMEVLETRVGQIAKIPIYLSFAHSSSWCTNTNDFFESAWG